MKLWIAILAYLLPVVAFGVGTDYRSLAPEIYFPEQIGFARRDESSGATVNALATSQSYIKLTATVATINGAVAPASPVSRMITISNFTGSSVTINNESGSATAANRFSLPGSISQTLPDRWSISFLYDHSQSRWVTSSVGGGTASADLTPGTGLAISAGTGTGAVLKNLTLSIASGYYLPVTADKTSWDQAAIDATQALADAAAAQADIDAHLIDAIAAHAASAISNTPSGNLAATDVQGALNEIQTENDSQGTAITAAQTDATQALSDAADAQTAADAAQADIDAHLIDAIAAHAASAISNTPSGNLAATDVQAALNELQAQLDTAVTALSVASSNGFTGSVTSSTTPVITIGTSITGIIKGNGTAISAASAGTDYQAPISTSAAVTHQFVTAFTAPNTFSRAQPDFTDVSGTATNSQLANMAGHTYKGNNTGSAAAPADVTSTQLTADLNVFDATHQGMVPASGGTSTNLFLNQAGGFSAAGTTSPLTTKGDIYTYSTTEDRLGVGANLSLLEADSSQATGLNWRTTSGTGAVARVTSPTFVTPTLGAASATTFNGNTWTVGSGILTIAAGKTWTVSNTLTIAGTDGSTLNVGTGGTIGPLGYAASLSAGLDLACSTRGAILYRGAAGWACLTPGTSGYALVSNGAGADPSYQAVSGGGGTNITQPIAMTAHGFSVGDVLYCTSTTSCSKAKADSATTSDVNGIVSAVTDANNFTLLMDGYITGLSGKTANTVYFLDASTAGAVSATQVSTVGYVDLPLLKTDSTTSGYFHIQRGVVITAAAAAGSGTGTALVDAYSITSHGFAVGDVVYCTSPTVCAKAKADADSTSEALGIVTAVASANAFSLTQIGYATGLSGLTANTTYYLSGATAGALTSVEPTTIGYISKPMFFADSTTTGYVLNMRGQVVTASSLNTTPVSHEIYLTNANGNGSTNTKVVKYSTVKKNVGTYLSLTQSSTLGDSITVSQAGSYMFCTQGYATAAQTSRAITVNGSALTTNASTPLTYAQGKRSLNVDATTNVGKPICAFVILAANDVVRSQDDGNSTATDDQTYFFGTYLGTGNSDAYLDNANGHGSTNTKIIKFSNIRSNVGSNLTINQSSVNGDSITVNSSGVYAACGATTRAGSGEPIGITVNDSAMTTTVTTPLTYAQGLRAYDETATNGQKSFVCQILRLTSGDILRLHDTGNTDGTDSLTYFYVTEIDTSIASSFYFLDSGLGHGSSATKVRTFSNVRASGGSDIVYRRSSLLGDSFTVMTPGVYTACYIDQRSASTTSNVITIDGQDFTTNSSSLDYSTQQQRGGGRQNLNYGMPEACWGGLLNAGQVIRFQDEGANSVTNSEVMVSIVRTR